MPIWGEARTGKTSLALSLMYKIYADWDQVLDGIVFNLSGLLYKMRKGEPRLFPTVNKPTHMRIPILLWDDYAAHSGKARTQHDKGWDFFKGAFDTLGTRLAVLLATMVNPRSPTQQLMEKYTHEVFIEIGRKGQRLYKYDKCRQQQDYYGWKPRQRKEWLEVNEFKPVPLDVFKQYDEMRLALVDEILVSIDDAMADTNLESLMRKVQPIDIKLLRLTRQHGPIHYHKLKSEFGEEGKKALTRCKARSLMTPVRKSQHYYVYDLTDLAVDLLRKMETVEGPEKSQSS